jgi:hypothetical protein
MHRSPLAIALVLLAVAGATAPAVGAGTVPAWKQALIARGEALNQRDHLGRYAIPSAVTSTGTPAWLLALERRSDALNRAYHLGRYAPAATSSPGGFDWRDAGIGAGFATALCVMLASLAFAARGRLRLQRLP